MATAKLPLSGNVAQAIWTAFLSPFDNQVGFVNVRIGDSSDAELETELLERVGSYGKQLGHIGDALRVLVKHFKPTEPLSTEEAAAITQLTATLDQIDRIKAEHRQRKHR